jgi:WhiB family redox-sensing transcriptional regulator
MGPDLFYSEAAKDIEKAQAICKPCKLRSECLEGAISRREKWGVWGGVRFVESTGLRLERARAAS